MTPLFLLAAQFLLEQLSALHGAASKAHNEGREITEEEVSAVLGDRAFQELRWKNNLPGATQPPAQ